MWDSSICFCFLPLQSVSSKGASQVMHMLMYIIRTEGLKGLYAGLGPNIIQVGRFFLFMLKSVYSHCQSRGGIALFENSTSERWHKSCAYV